MPSCSGTCARAPLAFVQLGFAFHRFRLAATEMWLIINWVRGTKSFVEQFLSVHRSELARDCCGMGERDDVDFLCRLLGERNPVMQFSAQSNVLQFNHTYPQLQ